MSEVPQNQIADWLKKLERESWQLELLVSAFTIFLLIQGDIAFEKFLIDIQYQYNFNTGPLALAFLFLGLLQKSLQALTISLIGHLMLRGFWIGAIGLRSVQSSIDFDALKYSDFFTEKLKSRVVSLDQLVFKLDEICSVIFAFAFLVISMLLAFGMYLLTLGGVAVLINTLGEATPESVHDVLGYLAATIFLTLVITGLIYMIDYFTLGFFKKQKWFRKVYYPFYRFYNVITLAPLSRSIYYYMISKFTKKKIRLVYAFVTLVLAFTIVLDFDQHPYFPEEDNAVVMSDNFYDDKRAADVYIRRASIQSTFTQGPHFQLFIRYIPRDNDIVREHCPDFEPIKQDGLNWLYTIDTSDGNLNITDRDLSNEDFDKTLSCLTSMYEVAINDSVYADLKYYFYVHPSMEQRGVLTTIPTDAFATGENTLRIRRVRKFEGDTTFSYQRYAQFPFWYQK